jgi:Domain of unknown function (DUF5801)/RTX calcium-binding nonapeptide repeat (4 copies)
MAQQLDGLVGGAQNAQEASGQSDGIVVAQTVIEKTPPIVAEAPPAIQQDSPSFTPTPAGLLPIIPVAAVTALPNSGAFQVGKLAELDASKVVSTINSSAGLKVGIADDRSVTAILVSGKDLVIQQDDGSLIVVKNGVSQLPSLVIGNLEISSASLGASLQAGGVTLTAAGGDTAAGNAGSNSGPSANAAPGTNSGATAAGETAAPQAPGSSGNNFNVNAGGVGAAFAIRDLLGYGEFDRQFEDRDLEEGGLVVKIDNLVNVVLGPIGENGNQAAEGGLPVEHGGNSGTEGSGEAVDPLPDTDPSEISSTGTITFDAPDGVAQITINGTPITGAGSQIDTPLGVLTITSIDIVTGVIEYVYTLTTNVTHPTDAPVPDSFTVVVTDLDGDSGSASFDALIKDDVPLAQAELVATEEGRAVLGQLDFTPGADGATVTHFAGVELVFGVDGYSAPISFAGGSIIVNASGAYVFSAPSDDVYIDPSEASTTFVVTDSDGDQSSANFSVTVGDTINDTTVTLSASSVLEGPAAAYTFTATLSNPSQGETTVVTTLGNIVIANGATTGTLVVGSNAEDVYLDASSQVNAIISATGGNFENLVIGTASATAQITDTLDDVTAMLTSGPVVYSVSGFAITYTVTLNSALAPFTTLDSDLVFNLQSGGPILFNAASLTTQSLTVNYSYGASTLINSITSVTGANEYEHLVPQGNLTIVTNTTPTGGGLVALTVEEKALDLVDDTLDIQAGTVTGTAPSDTTESAQATAGITFTTTGEGITIGFAAAGGAPYLSGLAAGYTIAWAVSGNQLLGSLMQGTSNLGLAVVLELSGALVAGPASSATPTVTVTLIDNLIHNSGAGDIAITNITVNATDWSGDVVTGTVAVTVVDDTPTLTVSTVGNALSQLALNVDETDDAAGTDRYNTGELADNANPDGNSGTAGLGTVTTSVAGGLTSLFTIGGTAGADGQLSQTGVLSFTGIPVGGLATNLLATNGGAITLFMNGAMIEGRDTTSQVVFTIAITGASGSEQLSITLNEAIRHGNTSLFDEVASLFTTTDAVGLKYEVTRVDNDNDSITQSSTVTIIGTGSSIVSIDDDGPKVSLSLVYQGGRLRVDETDGSSNEVDPAGGSLGMVKLTSALADQFFTLTTDYGSDGAATSGSKVFGLTIGASNVTGFVDTASGQNVVLVMNGTSVEGRTATSNLWVFTVSLDTVTGATTLEQFRAIVHSNTSNDDENSPEMPAGRLFLGVTITDGDGDSATSKVDLGSIISFKDDGPSLNIVGPPQVVNESATITGTWTLAPGSDGVASVVVTFGSTSGTLNLPAGANVVLTQVGLGTLTVMANGTYSFAAANVTANQTATFSILATDGDGDRSSDSQTITINNVNTAPSATAATARISEEGLNGSNPDSTGSSDTTNSASKSGTLVATDPEGDALTFTFGTPTTSLTQNGVNIVWIGSGTGALLGIVAGVTVIKAVIGAVGNYTVSVHGGVDQIGVGEGEVALTLPVTVSDGALSVSSTLTVTIEDDSPVMGAFDPGTIPNQIGTVTGEFVLSAGADGIDHFNITGPAFPGISYQPVTTLADGTSILLARTTVGNADVFSLTVRPDGSYTFNLIAPASPVSVTQSLVGLSAGGPSPFLETLDGLIEFTGSGTGVNSSTQGFGVANQFVDSGENFTMEFHSAKTVGNDAATLNPQIIQSLSFAVNNGSGSVSWIATNSLTGATQSGTATVIAGVLLIDPTIEFNLISITGNNDANMRLSQVVTTKNVLPQDVSYVFSVVAVDNDGDLSAAQQLNVHQTAQGNGGAFSLSGFAGTVDDAIAGSTAVDTISGVSGVDIADYSGSTGSISINLDNSGNASGAPTTATNPENGKIGGGDATGDTLSGIESLMGGNAGDFLTGNDSANLLAGNAGNDTLRGEGGADVLIGGLGDDTLIGGDGSDILKGGAGVNTLTGGTGSDEFYFDASALDGADTITDFISGTDMVDLTDLFTVDTAGGQTIGNYVQVTAAGALQVDIDGSGGAATMTTIINVTGATTGTVNILYDDNITSTDKTGTV